jgi:hypothetical protein
MLSFNSFIKEAEEAEEADKSKSSVDIASFLDKINNAKTESGLDELSKYYAKRKKEVEIKSADDITIRDAIDGRREEIESQYEVEEESVEEV